MIGLCDGRQTKEALAISAVRRTSRCDESIGVVPVAQHSVWHYRQGKVRYAMSTPVL